MCTLGDLVDDIVVRAAEPPVHGADVVAVVSHHRGGSAANVAAAVARCGGRARFVGQVGADPIGDLLIRELQALGVECAGPRAGRSATVVVVVDPGGERTMFSDRRCAADLSTCDPHWLDGAGALHVPYYSLQGGPLEQVARALLREARARGVIVSIDPSSVTFLDPRSGLDEQFRDLVREVRPDVVLCNEDEAAALGVGEQGLAGTRITVVKQGPRPVVLRGAVSATVPAMPVDGPLDTTGAGDAFAGGFLAALVGGEDPVAAARAGHGAAARVVRGPGADAWEPIGA